MEPFSQIIELVGSVMDGLGVLVLIVGALYAMIAFLLRRRVGADDPYQSYRKNMGKAILLGLELLVAADIIRTVVVSPTIENVLTLGLIVLIRTFLSISLQVELEGRWPWQRGASRVGENAEQ
jgi:uncharacterized membrane protein